MADADHQDNFGLVHMLVWGAAPSKSITSSTCFARRTRFLDNKIPASILDAKMIVSEVVLSFRHIARSRFDLVEIEK